MFKFRFRFRFRFVCRFSFMFMFRFRFRFGVRVRFMFKFRFRFRFSNRNRNRFRNRSRNRNRFRFKVSGSRFQVSGFRFQVREHRRATRSFTNCFINAFSLRCVTCAKDFMWKPLCAELPFHGNETRHKHVSKPFFGTLENCCVGFVGIKPGTCVCRLHSQMSS